MATFKDVVEHVLDVSGRPDKQAAARAQVNIAVRRIAGSGNYPLSLYEVSESGPFQDAQNTFPLIERFQAVGYVRALNSNTEGESLGGSEGRLEPILPGDIVNLERSFGYYVSGSNLIVKARTVPDTLLIGWHQYTERLVEDDDTNWVLDRFDYLVEEMAIAHLLTVVGAGTSAQQLQRFTMAYVQQEVRSAINPYESGP